MSESASLNLIGIPTRDRPGLLQRCVRSFLENARKFERPIEIVVADDSPGRSAREHNRSVLRTLRKEFPGSTFSHAGIEEKMLFAKYLLAGDIPLEVVKFAFFDSCKSGLPTYGANRNALLVHAANRALFCADDDTICDTASVASGHPEIKTVPFHEFSESYPWDVEIFPDRESVLGALEFRDYDLLSVHEQLLGSSVGELIQDQNGDSSAKVKISFNGMAGDCAWPSAFIYHLFTGESLQRITKSDQAYRRAHVSREVIKCPKYHAVGRLLNAPGMFVAFDLRAGMPPYFPVGRGEDIIYWNTVDRCVPDATFAAVSAVALHAPEGERSFNVVDPSQVRSSYDLFMIVLRIVRKAILQTNGEPDSGLRSLGLRMEETGTRPLGEFAAYLNSEMKSEFTELLDHLEEKLGQRECSSGAWRRDLTAIVKHGRATLADASANAPIDLMRGGRDENGALNSARQLVSLYGKLLQWWPAIVERTREGRLKGIELGQALS